MNPIRKPMQYGVTNLLDGCQRSTARDVSPLTLILRIRSSYFVHSSSTALKNAFAAERAFYETASPSKSTLPTKRAPAMPMTCAGEEVAPISLHAPKGP